MQLIVLLLICVVTDSKLTYDIGMNTGGDTDHMLSRGFRVVAVEANPILSASMKHQNLTVINKGIDASNGEMMVFWMNTHDVFSSFIKELGCRTGSIDWVCEYCECTPLNITTITCDSIVQQYGKAHYMKIDIEGRDRACLSSLQKIHMNDRPDIVSVETRRTDEWKDLLLSLGYCAVKLVDQSPFNNNGKQWSGPFGHRAKHLDGTMRWRRTEHASFTCPDNTWCDLHAKLCKRDPDGNYVA